MRMVFVGANELAVETAKILIQRDHEVVIIESDRGVIEELSEVLDCAFLHGDGTRPHILREANPKQTDMLFCLTYHDQTNIIASLVGRSLGFKRVITALEDSELEAICLELGLADTIIPSATISRYLADMATGIDILELSTAIKGEARCFSFVLESKEVRTVADLELPAGAKTICYYREEQFHLADEESTLQQGDDIVILTHSENLRTLRERWQPSHVSSEASEVREPRESDSK